jgi:hypothetical protein
LEAKKAKKADKIAMRDIAAGHAVSESTRISSGLSNNLPEVISLSQATRVRSQSHLGNQTPDIKFSHPKRNEW